MPSCSGRGLPLYKKEGAAGKCGYSVASPLRLQCRHQAHLILMGAMMGVKQKRPGGRLFTGALAERVGFEPTDALRHRLISSQVHSTTLPPLRKRANYSGGGAKISLVLGFFSGRQGKVAHRTILRAPPSWPYPYVFFISLVLTRCALPSWWRWRFWRVRALKHLSARGRW